MPATSKAKRPEPQPFLIEAATLATPRGRLAVFVGLSVAIGFVPYPWLGHLSLWQAIGWNGAPSIGLTRAYWLLLHGDPAAAWQRNPLIYAVLAIGLPLLGRDVASVLRGNPRGQLGRPQQLVAAHRSRT